jgi:hypothetical protein
MQLALSSTGACCRQYARPGFLFSWSHTTDAPDGLSSTLVGNDCYTVGVSLLFVSQTCAGNTVVWRREFEEGLSGISVDPNDRCHVVLTSVKGSIISMALSNPLREKVEQRQYRVDCSDPRGGAPLLVCRLSVTRDILYILLPRQVRR